MRFSLPLLSVCALASAAPAAAARCPQSSPVVPPRSAALDTAAAAVRTDAAVQQAMAERLSQAVQIPTVSFDWMREFNAHHPFGSAYPPESRPDARDERHPSYFALRRLHAFLETSYPRVHAALRREVVNGYALLYTWAGTDAALPPLALAAHLDVVPVEQASLDGWSYPPFAGQIADGRVWGRGSSDTKITFISHLEAVEAMLAADPAYRPRRTVLLAYGFDEEIGGEAGAGALGRLVVDRYGRDGLYALIDEGSGVVPAENDQGETVQVAALAVRERGYVDMNVTVAAPGGHSSMPPAHTSIGYAAQLIVALEKWAEAMPLHLQPDNPLYLDAVCKLEHGLGVGAGWDRLRELVGRGGPFPAAEIVDTMRAYGLVHTKLLKTTQAVTMIAGGDKINALPMRTETLINYRLDFTSSVDQHIQEMTALLEPLAREMGVAFVRAADPEFRRAADDQESDARAPAVSVYLTKASGGLNPSPQTPVFDPVWDHLTGTLQYTFGPGVGPAGVVPRTPLIAVPSVMGGNTDTRHYWDASKHLFRFVPIMLDHATHIHATNENSKISNLVRATLYWFNLIRSA